MIITVIFTSSISRLFFSVGFIGFALIITGGLLFVSDKYIKKGNKTDKTMTLGDAFIIGLSQAVATLPGLSRSGATISVGIARGLSPAFSVRFSLILSIPAVLGATIVSLYKAIRDGIVLSSLPVYIVGFIIATFIGFFAIQLIRRLVSKGGFGKFAYYCWAVGALAIILSLML
jgi:undecaprenyl-diphosphatase